MMRSRRARHHGLEEVSLTSAAPPRGSGEALRDRDERVECGERVAGVDRLAGEHDALGEIGTSPAASSAAAAFISTTSRRGPCSPPSTQRTIAAFSAASPPAMSASVPRAMPTDSGVIS